MSIIPPYWYDIGSSFLMKDRDIPILHGQFHGDARSQDISNHHIDLVKPK